MFFCVFFFFFFVETKWLNYTEKSRLSILSLALENFEWRELFLKLICLTSNLLHVPVTSSECKRCFSMMKRLRTGLWTSFLTKQLTAQLWISIKTTMSALPKIAQKELFCIQERSTLIINFFSLWKTKKVS